MQLPVFLRSILVASESVHYNDPMLKIAASSKEVKHQILLRKNKTNFSQQAESLERQLPPFTPILSNFHNKSSDFDIFRTLS